MVTKSKKSGSAGQVLESEEPSKATKATKPAKPVKATPAAKPVKPVKPAKSRATRPTRSHVPDPVLADLIEEKGADLSVVLPESLTIDVDLPQTIHAAPDDELAVAIEEFAISANFIHGIESGTTSVTVVAEPVATEVGPDDLGPVDGEVVPDPAYLRRNRQPGEVSATPEPAAMLTADRLLEVNWRTRAAPEGLWPAFLYAITFHLVNIGDSRSVRARKAIDARIGREFEGGTRFIPVLTRKGGVGKTTITTLLGMALADVREDRVIAVDANPDRGTLAERVNKQTRATVRDVVTRSGSISGFTEFSTMVSRDETRLDILASDTDPLLSDAFDDNDYNLVADLASRYYSIMLTDCGTGIVHSVMRATLQRADSVVIVSGGSIDEARLASETLTWLEANGYGDLVRNAVVAVNTATQGTNLVKLEEIEAHFASRVREVVRIPYDPQLAAGSVVNFKTLKPLTRDSAKLLAAHVVDGLPTRREI